MTAHPEIVPTLVDRIKQTLVGLKMPRAIEILDVKRNGKRQLGGLRRRYSANSLKGCAHSDGLSQSHCRWE